MYKVFIENTPLFILEEKDFKLTEGIFFHTKKNKKIKKLIFNCISSNKKHIPIYVISSNPKKVFKQLFNNFDFIEAAGGIVKRKNKFLFIKRNEIWDIPKGKMEKDETPETTAIREIEEECGIKNIQLNKLISITYHTYLYHNRPTIKKTYWYSVNYKGSKLVTPQIEEGITEVKWFNKKKIGTIIENTFESIKDVLSNYFTD
ncbi:MAG: NUDIX domain-containing protein [Flavobacteriia bacterium]|nr:NUDIX domain-containing protein [Flavobacteriia bacterium]